MRVLIAIGIVAAAVFGDDIVVDEKTNFGNADGIESVGLLQKAQRDNMDVTHSTLATQAFVNRAFCCKNKDDNNGVPGQCDAAINSRNEKHPTATSGRCNNIPDLKCMDDGTSCKNEEKRRSEGSCSKFKNPVGEDCTYKPLFQWLRGQLQQVQKSGGGRLHLQTPAAFKPFVAPSYLTPHTLFGEDENWKSVEGHQSGIESGTCVAYVKLGGGTCSAFCKSNGRTCAWAQDDADRQRLGLSRWLKGNNYKATKCTLLPSTNFACDQKWSTQICACK